VYVQINIIFRLTLSEELEVKEPCPREHFSLCCITIMSNVVVVCRRKVLYENRVHRLLTEVLSYDLISKSVKYGQGAKFWAPFILGPKGLLYLCHFLAFLRMWWLWEHSIMSSNSFVNINVYHDQSFQLVQKLAMSCYNCVSLVHVTMHFINNSTQISFF
jgi:hypothetical protein